MSVSSAAIILGAAQISGDFMFPLILAVVSKGDGDLMVRLQRRDPQALAELYDRYGQVAFRLILRMVRDNGIAEDLVQETFLRVWNRIGGFDSDRGAVGPWVLAVARNRAIDYLRSREHRTDSNIELNETEHPELFADLSTDVFNFDVIRQVKRALNQLDAQPRQAIELAYFEGMSQTEIAERMGQPLGTVKTWTRRAIQQMRTALGGTVSA